ncbi:MAG TPA: hypothetical protein VK174_02695 [Chitinophagales bacterium]|nr:hypothetical protein [Chitinophagales bacterium]
MDGAVFNFTFVLQHAKMPIFSENIVYRSPLNTEKALEAVTNSIEKNGLTQLEYWTQPARFFKGKVDTNSFKLTYCGNHNSRPSISVDPYILGHIQPTEDGSLIEVKISYPSSRTTVVATLTISLLFGAAVAAGVGIIIGLILASISLLINLLFYKWKSSHTKVLLENLFHTTGEDQ